MVMVEKSIKTRYLRVYQAGEFSADEGGNSGGASSGGGSAPAGC